jgi:hypothetical protein
MMWENSLAPVDGAQGCLFVDDCPARAEIRAGMEYVQPNIFSLYDKTAFIRLDSASVFGVISNDEFAIQFEALRGSAFTKRARSIPSGRCAGCRH